MFLEKVMRQRRATAGYRVVNVDVTILAERPKLEAVQAADGPIARRSCSASPSVNIKAGTNEGCDAIGRGEAIAAHAVVLLAQRRLAD